MKSDNKIPLLTDLISTESDDTQPNFGPPESAQSHAQGTPLEQAIQRIISKHSKQAWQEIRLAIRQFQGTGNANR